MRIKTSHPRESTKATDTRASAGVRSPRHGLARTLSRMGVCSRSEAERRVIAGRVALNGGIVRDPEAPVDARTDRITVDGVGVQEHERICIAINKPRGLIVSAADEHGRDTVFALLQDAGLPWLAPVGRLDKASEGLLLMSNDPAWAARITDPQSHLAKTYRVQVRGVPSETTLQRLRSGIIDRGERLSASSVCVIGGGDKNAWLEIVLTQGRNRQIRRMLAACGHDVLRLLRVAIGPLQLGGIPKGCWRRLTVVEADALAAIGKMQRDRSRGPDFGVTQPGDRRRSRFPSPANPRRPR